MGIAEKKPDTLSAIQGAQAQRYEQQVRLLMGGELPAGWQWIASSRDTAVAMTTSEPLVYYKEFLPRTSFERVKALLRGNRCERARRQADILRAAGLPTPDLLCWGKGRHNAFLITRGFSGIGFFHYVKSHYAAPLSPEQIREKRLLLAKAGALLGSMHRQGIVHGDLRQNNLLVRKEGEDFRFTLIDNESNRKWPHIPRSQIIKNLVQFAIFSDKLLTRPDLLRLFAAYSASYPRFAGRRKRQLLQIVHSRSQARNLEIKVKGEIRANCRSFTTENFQGKFVAGSIVDQQLARGVDPAQWFCQTGQTLKHDKNITVKLLSGPGGELIAKRFTSKNLLYYAKIWLKKERALRLWEMSHCFQALGLPVAAPLGYVLEGRGLWRTVSYFYSRHLAGARDLVVIGREKEEHFPAWLEQKGIIARLARLLAILHNNGLCHGDTKWANILADSDSGQFWLIDLDGAGRLSSALDRRVRKDLSRFLVDMIETGLPRSLQEEFVAEYCRLRRLNRNLVQAEITPHIDKTLARHRKKRRAPG
ncbi:MAG: lipopolysaccharide kinase InaA family protein [Thermodesulfobacteriota bacterium]